MKISSISSAIAIALGTAAFSAQAELTTSAVLEFDAGALDQVCAVPDGNVPPNCSYGIETDVVVIGHNTNPRGKQKMISKAQICINFMCHVL